MVSLGTTVVWRCCRRFRSLPVAALLVLAFIAPLPPSDENSKFSSGHAAALDELKPMGTLFGVTDCLLDTPYHATYETGAYANVLFFDMPALLEVS